MKLHTVKGSNTCEETFENTQWRKVKKIETTQWSQTNLKRHREENSNKFETAQYRKVKQVQPLWLRKGRGPTHVRKHMWGKGQRWGGDPSSTLYSKVLTAIEVWNDGLELSSRVWTLETRVRQHIWSKTDRAEGGTKWIVQCAMEG